MTAEQANLTHEETEHHQSLDDVESRIKMLELLIGSKSVQEATPSDAGLSGRVRHQEKALQRILNDKPWAKELLEKYDRLSDLVNEPAPNLEFERRLLTPRAMAEIVLAAEPDLLAAAESLRETEALSRFVNPPEFQAVQNLTPQLGDVETRHCDQTVDATEVIRRTTNLITKYNNDVQSLSSVFVTWDQLLDEMEMRIERMERSNSVRIPA